MGARECYAVGGNGWHASIPSFGKFKEVKIRGKDLERWGLKDYLGRCYYLNTDALNTEREKKGTNTTKRFGKLLKGIRL